MKEHIVSSYENELRDLTRKVAEMGGRAERLVADSVAALLKRDAELAERVIVQDKAVDVLQREIEEDSIAMIARRNTACTFDDGFWRRAQELIQNPLGHGR